MQQNEAVLWLRRHPDTVHRDLDDFLRHCEQAVRERVAEHTWLLAKERAEAEAEAWTHHGGYRSSDAWVAKEVLPIFATELEGHPPTDELVANDARLDGEALGDVEPEAREVVGEFARAVAADACLRTWQEIVRFTRSCPREWERAGRVHEEIDWDRMAQYPELASRLLHMLADELESHAHAH
jgi:hypothetical protein